MPTRSAVAGRAVLTCSMLLWSASALAGSLTTTFVGGNSQSGNIFNIAATNTVTITGFDIKPNWTGTATVEIYYRPEDGYPYIGTSSGWTLVGSASMTVGASGLSTPVPMTIDVLIPAGETYGWYITTTASSLSYTNGTTVGASAASNSDLSIQEGFGIAYPFGSSFFPRIWNGTVYYNTEDCFDAIDNDSDGDVDCDDSDCSYEPLCDCDKDFDGYDDTTTLCGGDDCDDMDDTIHPGVTEVCDGVDEDCDGTIDDGAATTYYKDVDGDGYGGRATTKACSKPSGYVTNTLDCDDSDKDTHPGGSETCDAKDNDCDGTVDEGVTTTYYADADGDGYGGDSKKEACTIPTGYLVDSTDCDDTDSRSHPGGTETCDLADNDCDGTVDEGVTKTYYRDSDGDTYGDAGATTAACTTPSGYVTSKTDCNDADATIKPGATEICDGIDNNCNTKTDEGIPAKTWYYDSDLDTFGDATVKAVNCMQPTGYIEDKTDCDDADDTIYPGAPEVAYDGIDQDCDTSDLVDVDADGYDYDLFGGTDCIDDDATVHPGVGESADGVDEDCDGKVDEGTDVYDDDGDGYTDDGGDCDDASKTVHPGVVETCDSVDSDCDGAVDDATSCYDDDDDGYTEDEGDCDDASDAVRPGLVELADNGVDDDCDGATDFGIDDHDDDGYTGTDGADCDDEDPTSHPGAPEVLDGADNDCDAVIDEGTEGFDDDGDGTAELDGDCNDADAAISSSGIEVENGADDDCDGLVDEGSLRTDDDGDGFTEEGGDCDDADDAVHPGAIEVGNTLDDDCDALVDEGIVDADLDGYTVEDGDCDDTTGWRSPGVGEMCDGIDNNCDDVVDEGVCVTITEDTDPPDTDVDPGGQKKQCGSTGGVAGWIPGLLGLLLLRRRAA